MNIRWLYTHRALVAMLVAAALAVGLMTVLVIRQRQDLANGQVYLEAGGSVGSNPFVPLTTLPATVGENPGNSGGPEGASFQTTVSPAGRPTCDIEKIISHLTADARAGEAWVSALNSDRTLAWSGGNRIEAWQIPAYVHELRSRVLAEDLRVTNYQFANGAPLAVQAVLQKGTAILVDATGIARVRCVSGNPLAPMVQSKGPPIYRGTPWPSFQPQRVIVTQRAPQCGRDESYDGQRCRQISVCPHSEVRGDDGWCDGSGQPDSSENGRTPNGKRWLDRPGGPDESSHPDKPEQPDDLPPPDNPTSPDELRRPHGSGLSNEPSHPERSTRTEELPHGDKPRRSEKLRHPDKADQPEEPQHEDIPRRSEKPKQPDKTDQSSEAPQREDKPTRSEKDEHPDKSKRVHQPAQRDDDEQSDSSKRADKPGKSDGKSDKAGQSKKPENSEKSKNEPSRHEENSE